MVTISSESMCIYIESIRIIVGLKIILNHVICLSGMAR